MTPHDHPYHDLLFRLDVAMLGSCTCLTKTPDYTLHDEKCRYRALREASIVIGWIPQLEATSHQQGWVEMESAAADAEAQLADEWKAKVEAYDAMLRDFAFRHGAGGYNSDGLIDPDVARDKLEWAVSEATHHAKASLLAAGMAAEDVVDLSQAKRLVTQLRGLVGELLARSPYQIAGLGRMTNDEDGYMSLHFQNEAFAQQFMRWYSPSVEITDMPPLRNDRPGPNEALDLFRRALLNIHGDNWRADMQAVIDAVNAGPCGDMFTPCTHSSDMFKKAENLNISPADDDIAAAEKLAELYDGDDRQDIKTDVMNAFYRGAHHGRVGPSQERDHWKANHDQMVERLRLFTQRPDLPVDRIAAHLALAKYQDTSKALGAALAMALQRIYDMLQEDDGQAFKEAKRALPTMWSAMALATGTLPEWDTDFIMRLWSESWNEALRDAGVGIGNVDTAHINQPIVFTRKLFATVFSPSPAREQYAASMVLEREKLKAWIGSLKANQGGDHEPH